MRARRELTLLLSWTVAASVVPFCAPGSALADSSPLAVSTNVDQVRAPAWPCRLVVASDLRPSVATVWERSQTFREQCTRLARTNTLVLLRTATAVEIRRPAQSLIGVAQDGATVAHVRIRLSGDRLEHIGHELEHVLEYLDKVNLRAGAGRHRSGITVSSVGYETDRAIDAGTRVAREVRASREAAQ